MLHLTCHVCFQRSNFVINMDKSLLRNYNEMVENSASNGEQVVDARGESESSVINGESD